MEEGPLASDLIVADLSMRGLGEVRPRIKTASAELHTLIPSYAASSAVRRRIAFALISSIALLFSLCILIATDLAIQKRSKAFQRMPTEELLHQIQSPMTGENRRAALINLALERRILLAPKLVPPTQNRIVNITVAKYAANMDAVAFADRLMEHLGSPDPGVRRASAKALGILGVASAIAPLRSALASETEEQVRETIMAALDAIASNKTVDSK